ncbi:MAG TPA: NDP-sugar synthase [Vicinamibacteria bacterium]|nr:NDP-sugar synthase [Vicinamibacteria bacterium]
MVLAAGLGLRMRPLTERRAKAALPVLGRPLIAHTLERLARAGVTDVVVNLHHRPASVRRAVGDGRRFGLRVRYSFERRILGTAGGPRKARRLLGDGPVLLVNGDVLFDFDLRALVERHRRGGGLATLALKANPDPRAYGPVVTDSRGRVLSLAGRPRPARGRVSLFTGVHVLEPVLLGRLRPGASDSVRDLYAPLVAEGSALLGVRVKGAWYDLGGPAQYLAAHRLLLRRTRQGRVVDPSAAVAAGARVTASVVGAGARIGAGATVAGSVLWERVAVGAEATVRGSIVADGARVRPGERIEGQVVTRHGRRPL